MIIELEPIGFVQTDALSVPRHWTLSDVSGRIVVHESFAKGLRDIGTGEDIIVLFNFHQSRPFTESHLVQKPPHREEQLGVFSTCSPIRPNPIGMSVLRVLDRKKNVLYVKGLDMVDKTPILDIKPLTGLKREREI